MTTRADFDRSLRQLQEELLSLGSLAEQAITRAVEALQNRDLHASRRVIEDDDIIDQARFHLEEQCIYLMATQQPLAIDLRTLITITHVAVELERMGDYAEGIAKISLAMGDEPPLKPLIDIPRMADKATDMLRRSLDTFMHAVFEDQEENSTKQEAVKVCEDDDEVDALYDQVYRELLTFMMQDPSTIQRATYLLWVAHNLERIAERVIFLVTGELVEINVSSY